MIALALDPAMACAVAGRGPLAVARWRRLIGAGAGPLLFADDAADDAGGAPASAALVRPYLPAPGDIAALRRHGAAIQHAPAMSMIPHVDDPLLLERTAELVARPPQLLIATTGVGMRGWFEAAYPQANGRFGAVRLVDGLPEHRVQGGGAARRPCRLRGPWRSPCGTR